MSSALEQALQENKEQEVVKKKTIEETFNQGVESSRYYSVKAMSWFSKYFTELLMFVVAFALIGMLQFAEANWSWDFFIKASFWFELITYVTAQWLVLISSINSKFKTLLSTDLMWLDYQQEIQDYVDLDNGEITRVANQESRERKIRKYIQLKTEELKKLLNKYRINTIPVLEVYLGLKEEASLIDENNKKQSDTNVLLLKGINIPKRKENAVKTKLLSLYNELSDDYIQQNIENVKVKYNRVTYTILTNGKSKSYNKNDDSTLDENVGGEIFSEFGVSQIILFLMMGVIIAMDLSAKEATIATVVGFVLKSIVLIWNSIQGNFRASIIFKNTYIRATVERLQILRKTNLPIKRRGSREAS